MEDTSYAPVCGICCGACQFLGQQCPGCGVVGGRPFWTADMPGGICPLHDCCRNQKHLEHCGLCAGFPCKTFAELRDPSMTDEEFAESLNARKAGLKTRTEIGTQAWLLQQTGRQPAGGVDAIAEHDVTDGSGLDDPKALTAQIEQAVAAFLGDVEPFLENHDRIS